MLLTRAVYSIAYIAGVARARVRSLVVLADSVRTANAFVQTLVDIYKENNTRCTQELILFLKNIFKIHDSTNFILPDIIFLFLSKVTGLHQNVVNTTGLIIFGSRNSKGAGYSTQMNLFIGN